MVVDPLTTIKLSSCGGNKSVALNGKPSDDNDLAMRQADKNESCRIGTDQQWDRKKKTTVALINPYHHRNPSNATGDSYSPRE